MPKTKEQIKAYNKEYFARPEVIARAKIRNAKPAHKIRRKLYKKTERGKEAERRYIERNRERLFENRYKSRVRRLYGLTYEQYQEILEKQNGACAICLKEQREASKRLHIDHDHVTGKVRGLLCTKCNMGIGLFGDNVDLLDKATKYLNAIHQNDGLGKDSQP